MSILIIFTNFKNKKSKELDDFFNYFFTYMFSIIILYTLNAKTRE
jgi:hypothetical protein